MLPFFLGIIDTIRKTYFPAILQLEIIHLLLVLPTCKQAKTIMKIEHFIVFHLLENCIAGILFNKYFFAFLVATS